MRVISSHRCFGGTLVYYRHDSTYTQCSMRFSVFLPAQQSGAGILYLSGLTCTENNFTTKAGAYRVAAELGLTIVAPDTSPRGLNVPDDKDIAIGHGAGFYIDATQEPWQKNYRMYSYIVHEIVPLCYRMFGIQRLGIMGHSMGGHGAFTIALKNRDLFVSVSALAPVCAASQHGFGVKTFTTYLGHHTELWKQHDATLLMAQYTGKKFPPILLDQGLADASYLEERLQPEGFVAACTAVGQPIVYRTHSDYDHGYFFVQSFIDDHLRHHHHYSQCSALFSE